MSSIKKNYLYQVSYEILSILIPLITAPYVTRILGDENLGVFSYTQSVANLFLSLSRLGIVNHGSRSIAKVQHDLKQRSKVFWDIYAIQLSFSVFVTLFYLVYIILFIRENRLIALLQCIWVASSIIDIAWAFMGVEDFKTTVMRGFSIKILSLFLILTLVKNPTDLWIYTLIVTGSTMLGNILLLTKFKKHFCFVKPSKNDVVSQIKPLVVLFIPTIAVTIYTMMDKIMLGNISGNNYVAYYEYSSKLVSIPMGFITSFGAVMLPRISSMNAEQKDEQKQQKLTSQSLVFVMFLSTAFAFGLAAVSNTLIPLYYGMSFVSCVSLLKVVAIKLPAMAWANVIRTQVLIPANKDKQYIISLFAGAGVNFCLNYFLIPNLKDTGAAIATVIAEIVVCVFQSIVMNNSKIVLGALRYSFEFIIDGIIMYITVRLIAETLVCSELIKLLIEIATGVLTYCVIGLIFVSVNERKSPITIAKYLLIKMKK